MEEQPKPTGKKPNTKLIIGIILGVLIIGGGIVGYLFTHKGTIRTKEGTIKYDGDNTTFESGDGSTSSVGGKVTVPANFPKTIPVYKNGTLTSIGAKNTTGGYVMTTKDTETTIMPWFKTELTKVGWTIDIESSNRFDFRNTTQVGTVFVDKDVDGNTTINVNIMDKSSLEGSSGQDFDDVADEVVNMQNNTSLE